MATGAGKTTVMGMLAAWSILNKVNDRNDARFSDVVLVVCPNVTIREPAARTGPRARARRASTAPATWCPPHLMPPLTQGRVLVTNWHVFEPQGDPGRRRRRPRGQGRRAGATRETIIIGAKTTTARGTRYLTLEDYERQVAAGLLTVLKEDTRQDGNLEEGRGRVGAATSRATPRWSTACWAARSAASRTSS